MKQSQQIWIIFLIPSLLSAFLLTWFLQRELHHWAIESWSSDHSAFANSLSQQIDAKITEASNLLKYTSSLPEFSSLPEINQIKRSLNGIPFGVDKSKRMILDQLKMAGNFSVLFVLTPSGDHYLSHPYKVQEKLKKFNLADRPYFIEAQKTKNIVISDSFVGADGIPAIAINVPILGPDNKIVAHLGGVMHLTQMSSLIRKHRITPFDRAIILDRKKNSVADSHRHLPNLSLDMQQSNVKQHIGTLLSIHSAVDRNGEAWLQFEHALNTGWELILLRRMSTLSDEIAPNIRNTLWLGGTIILLTSFIGLFLALRFSRRWQEAEMALQQANVTLEEKITERTAQLENSEVRHRTLFETTADAVVLISNNKIIDCNNSALKMFGVTEKACITDHHIADLSADTQSDGSHSLNEAEHRISKALAEGSLRFEWLHKRLDTGEVFPTEVALSALVIDKVALVQGTIRDIRGRIKTEAKIRTLSQAIEQSPVSVVITDTSGNIEYVNQAFEKITGYSESEVLGKNSRLLQSGNTPRKRYSELWKSLLNGQPWLGEFQNKRKNGELFWEQAHIAPVSDAQGCIQHFLAVKQDVTPQKHQEAQILRQAHFDSLTELPNRFLSLNRLEEYIKEAKRHQNNVGVIFLDLDDFKKVNDSLGHETGDELLKMASKRLQSVIRETDTVGRLGGDEFIIILGNLQNPNDVQPIVEKILSCFHQPITLNNRDLVITASLGIAFFPENGKQPAELLRNADTAMYHSKAKGRNTFEYFTSKMNLKVRRRLELEEQLRSALQNQELTVNYQPIINVSDRKIIGAEALIRWSNPLLSTVSPEEFIPIAENTGLIVPIGEFVLTQALTETAEWIKIHPNFRIAINISPRQFRDSNLSVVIEEQLQQSGLSGRNIEFEITEGVLLEAHINIDKTLQQLQAMGIGISMDDFGTGYSSLNYLRSYPFTTLKIDRSFIRDINDDSADRELVNAAIAMAHALGLTVVAEGVETEEQFLHLTHEHCNFAQGFLFSQALPASKFTDLLLNNKN